ncbi:hypothetical protein [Myroides marinus]|uniref:hypothetical protein n=1 Tax=Myroides marinus TaxID=703342 RepID=UPI002578D463|nr:hypothetical protein [Myroides marinus]MDM1378614.1 hypothetical protein [Myroides marinus]MDM1385885.1 hypothetical protein [Myroides marinus]MDM1393098.1 hypothetical protein [Myroides marinus]
MKSHYLLIFVFGVFSVFTVKAQNGIGTSKPNGSAQLEVTALDKGVLLPRVALSSVTQQLQTNVANANSLMIYNTTNLVSSGLVPGYYYWLEDTVTPSKSKWTRVINSDDKLVKSRFFYMPSIVINTSAVGVFKRNLHAEYLAQFTGKTFVMDANGGTINSSLPSVKFIKSTGGTPETTAPAEIPNLPLATDMWYYITDYDTSALENLSIDQNGVLSYTVKGTGTDYSFVNVVFVIK